MMLALIGGAAVGGAAGIAFVFLLMVAAFRRVGEWGLGLVELLP